MLDYQWAARLKLRDPVPEKKKEEGGGSMSLTSFVDESDDILDRYEGVCWYCFREGDDSRTTLNKDASTKLVSTTAI